MTSDSTNNNNVVAVKVNAKLMVMIVFLLAIIAYVSGYIVSSNTGVEPGFFEIAEAGGYGVAAEAKPAEGLSEDIQKHYDKLADDD